MDRLVTRPLHILEPIAFLSMRHIRLLRLVWIPKKKTKKHKDFMYFVDYQNKLDETQISEG